MIDGEINNQKGFSFGRTTLINYTKKFTKKNALVMAAGNGKFCRTKQDKLKMWNINRKTIIMSSLSRVRIPGKFTCFPS